jgi:hypothetical protein
MKRVASPMARVAEAVLGPAATIDPDLQQLEFTVDGVAVTAAAQGRHDARLTCTVAAELPADETAVRRLMGAYFRYCDRAGGILCSDADGALLLWTDVGEDDAVADRLAAFCDAAVHWTKLCRSHLVRQEPARHHPIVIFP